MTLSERTRHEVYEHARRTWSDEAAEALMEMLPPVGWADIATKRDLDVFATKADLHHEVNRLILWFVPFNVALALGVARLAG